MNKANLKSYAPTARLDFIKAVTERANVLGISAAAVVPAELRGDVALIDGREWPAKVAGQRDELIARVKRHGFEQTMDEVAYTWFNRFAALRYMEIHDYLGHGWRVLSSRDGGLPEILRHASEVTLPGLNADRAREMQLAGNQDNELYKLLLVAQCNELSRVMPFLFERIDDETELLLPENLLRTDSIVAKLVEQVPEEDWQEIEVIGWLYQFYISEKKDQVIGKVVESEDIPAATQLFTPNWIVQYLVQNSVGRLWLMANPTSALASHWPYTIQPAEQTPEVQAQLDAFIQTRIREDGETVNPETITVLDPACGSGHILVVAYDVLKTIYLERGYQPRTIPRLILEKNIFGLDIDDRAAQLAAFALLMRARADDRRLFADPLKLNVLTLQESKGLDVGELTSHLTAFGVQPATIRLLVDAFEHAKTFGSLIQIPPELNEKLPQTAQDLQRALLEGDLYAKHAAKDLFPLVLQGLTLGALFDAVVANPPYMGSRYYNGLLKRFVEANYAEAKGDLYTCFMIRSLGFSKVNGFTAAITIPNWMFLSTYENLRGEILISATVDTFLHNGRGVFGSDFGSCAFVFRRCSEKNYRGRYKRLFDKQGSVSSNEELATRFDNARVFEVSSAELEQVPGQPFAYWVTEAIRRAFQDSAPLGTFAIPKQGLATADNDRFVRRWYEISFTNIKFDSTSIANAKDSGKKWFPYNKGGEFRRWFGNQEFVVNWEDNGAEIKSFVDENGKVRSRPQNSEYYFRRSISWSDITSATTCFRYFPDGFIHDVTGMSAFPPNGKEWEVLGFCNSLVASEMVRILNPTVHFQIGDFLRLPHRLPTDPKRVSEIVERAIHISREDWNSFETAWAFKASHLFAPSDGDSDRNIRSLKIAWQLWSARAENRWRELMSLEHQNNVSFINTYGLTAEILPEVSESQITLTRADREKDCQRLISYAIGCMMGRYSLDEPGLVYACAGNIGFDPGRYKEDFPADADGILPLTDEQWFKHDAASRMPEFLRTVWGAETVEENMAWIAESLGTKGVETAAETVRRYLADKFFKDHVQTYKKRPIYWLFSSGKHGSFQALVYLHRYHDRTLARMRAEYVVPLIAKIASRLEVIDKDIAAASSAAARAKLQKQIEGLRKKQIELVAYDEKLRHYTDMRISLDLDDGVKANYAKFGDLVAQSKAITGGGDE